MIGRSRLVLWGTVDLEIPLSLYGREQSHQRERKEILYSCILSMTTCRKMENDVHENLRSSS